MALDAVGQLCGHTFADRFGACCGVWCVWLLCLSLTHQGGLLLHHHAGHDLCRHALVFS